MFLSQNSSEGINYQRKKQSKPTFCWDDHLSKYFVLRFLQNHFDSIDIFFTLNLPYVLQIIINDITLISIITFRFFIRHIMGRSSQLWIRYYLSTTTKLRDWTLHRLAPNRTILHKPPLRELNIFYMHPHHFPLQSYPTSPGESTHTTSLHPSC